MVCIVLLVEIWPWLHFNSIRYLVYITFLRILVEFFLDISWRLIVCVQLRKSRLLSESASLLIRKHKRLASRIFGRAHALGCRHLLTIMRLENTPYNLLALGWNPTPGRNEGLAWVLWIDIVILKTFLAPTSSWSAEVVPSFKALWNLLSTVIHLIPWDDLQLVAVLDTTIVVSDLDPSNVSYTKSMN